MKAAGRLLAFLLLAGAVAPGRAAAPSALGLADCLRLAVDHNAQMRAASVQFLDAGGRALRLHAILYPSVQAQALSAPMTFYIQINEVFYSRATFPQLRISRLARDQAVINYRQTLSDVAFQVRQAFYTALGAQKEFELVRESAGIQARALATAQQLFEAGKVEKSAVLSVQVTSSLVAQRQSSAQLAVTQARLALSQLIGQALPGDVPLSGDLEPGPPPAGLPDEGTLAAEALRDRPDLKMLESLHLSEQQQVYVDLKNAFPTIGFSSNSAIQPPELGLTSDFDLERNYDEPEVQREVGNTQLPLSLYFTWIIFDGGALAGVAATDRARLETREIAIAELKRSIPGEVAGALHAVRTERQTLQLLGAQTPPDELRHSAQLDYQAGRIRQLDLVNLESDILQQEQARLASEIRLRLALAALDHALGRGLQTEAPPGEAGRHL